MPAKIIDHPLTLNIYGFSGIALNRNYGAKAFELSGQMWNAVKSNNLKNKGQNIWVYEDDHRVFAGVEMDEPPPASSGLEHKIIQLPRYGYYKHIGPYALMKQGNNKLLQHIAQNGFNAGLPYIEIYGDWNKDESKLETELIHAIG